MMEQDRRGTTCGDQDEALPPATEPPEAAEIEPAGGIVKRAPAPGAPPAPNEKAGLPA